MGVESPCTHGGVSDLSLKGECLLRLQMELALAHPELGAGQLVRLQLAAGSGQSETYPERIDRAPPKPLPLGLYIRLRRPIGFATFGYANKNLDGSTEARQRGAALQAAIMPGEGRVTRRSRPARRRTHPREADCCDGQPCRYGHAQRSECSVWDLPELRSPSSNDRSRGGRARPRSPVAGASSRQSA